MPSWNGTPIPSSPQIKIPNSIPQNFNWESYISDPKGTFNKFKGAREVNRMNWKGYRTASANAKKAILSSPSKKVINAAKKQIKSLRGVRKTAEAAKKVAETAEKTSKTANKLSETTKKAGDKLKEIVNKNKTAVDAIKKTSETAKKVADNAKKVGDKLKEVVDKNKILTDTIKKASDLTEKIHKALFSKIPGSNFLDSASRVGGILGILAAIGVVALLKLQEFVSGRTFDDLLTTQIDLTKVNTIATNAGLKLKSIDTKLQKINTDLDSNAKDYYQLNKKQDSLDKSISEAKKQSNDALYETRQGRTILESKIAESKKESNDALYETRQNKTTLESQIVESKKQSNDALYETRQTKLNLDIKIQQVNTDITRIGNNITSGVQSAVDSATSKLQAELAIVKLNLATIKPATPVDIAAINANAVAAAKAEARIAQNQVIALQNVVSGLGVQTAAALALGGTAINGISNLAQGVSSANNTANSALSESQNVAARNLGTMQQQLDTKFNATVAQLAKDLNIRDLSQSNLSKEFDQKLSDFTRRQTLTSDQVFQEFVAENNKALKIRDLQQSELSKEFDRKNENFFRQSTLTADQRYQEFIAENRASLGLLKSDLGATEVEVKQIDTKIREQEKVNAAAIPKLDQILGFLPLIPGRAADAIRPDIATLPQIEAAAAAGTCRTAQPGGCMSKALDNNAANINNNTNNKTGNILGAVNAIGQGADLALLGVINNKLGNQLPGGIGGKLSRFADWMHLDRTLNLMIWATTIHNGLMLSNNLGQTLFSLISNVLSAVGLKNAEGEAFDIGSVISAGFENIIKSAVGAENYKTLSTAWKNANRIYQATANVLNSVQSIGASVLNALEVVGQWNAKVGNALRRFGAVGEKAYGWMNPKVDFSNKWFTAIENATNVISQIDQVASEVLSIKETVGQFTEQKKELSDSLKEVDASKQKVDLPEAVKLAEKEKESKAASAALPLVENDKEADED